MKYFSIMSEEVRKFPSSLLQHLTSKLIESINDAKIHDVDSNLVAKNIIDALLKLPSIENNKQVLESGIAISKCLRVYPNLIGVIDSNVNVSSILDQYTAYLANNNSVFMNIKDHHDRIGTVEWTKATANEASLAVYSTAAEKMGDRLWVQKGNDWMKQFAIQFFKEGGAKKHYMRVLREQYLVDHGIEWPNEESIKCNESLDRDLVKALKIRLLDVGSCYNPFGTETGASSSLLDVTALDLYPAHPSVLQCDFLNLAVGSPDSAPVTVGPSGSSTISSSSSGTGNQDTTLDPTQMTKLLQLPAGSFDVVTMSLVLNYLPSPVHRELMIAKARQLLIGTGHSQHPHHRGLLLIVEKHSIFGKDHVECNNLYSAGKGALLKNFKQSICNLGFELVKYREMEPVNNRRSHLFAFATVEVASVVLHQQCDRLSSMLSNGDVGGVTTDPEGKLLPRLWIKQDFDAMAYGRGAQDVDTLVSNQPSRKRDRDDDGESS